jgi:hypothetical protein
MQPQPTQQLEWEKEFEKEFKESFSGGDMNSWERAEPIIQFISTLISQERSKWQAEGREQVEGLPTHEFKVLGDRKFVEQVDVLSLPFLKEDK